MSLRAQLSGKVDSALPSKPEAKPKREAKDLATKPAEPMPAPAASAEASSPKNWLNILIFAGVMAAFWAGSAIAYLGGYFQAQGLTGVGGLDVQILAFAALVTFLPPFLFIAAAYALYRAQTMADTAQQLANVSLRLTSVDENAIQGAQRLGRAVRRELDALTAGMDTTFGRLRALETALEDRVAQLEEASARAGVKADIIVQRLQ